ncbi:MAG: HEAT repeat domain-containing protein [Thermodesulfobacteriota bacterium]|nr:HEAT repeat domain-containing protein [Thermodesulfobacteriota bacterium]
MVKPHGRKIKKQVGGILLSENREDAFYQLRQIPGQMLAGPLFSYFYSLDDLIRFRSSTAMGDLAHRLAEYRIEDSRIILRRLMWNLNDESGGMAWGSVEAMGEILKRNKTLAGEFESILFSYIDPDGNFLEHEMLQRGSLWGVGTYLETSTRPDKAVIKSIIPFLDSNDPVKRGYAVRALVNMDDKNIDLLPAHIFSDKSNIPLFDGWNLHTTSVSLVAQKK